MGRRRARSILGSVGGAEFVDDDDLGVARVDAATVMMPGCCSHGFKSLHCTNYFFYFLYLQQQNFVIILLPCKNIYIRVSL